MAIGAGSIVSPKTNGAGGAGIPINGPMFGVVESGTGPYVVLWYDGNRVQNVAAATIDEILTVSGGTVAATFVGRRVKVNVPAGQNNWGIMVCVGCYNRSNNDVLLLQNPTGQYYLEALASQCTALEG